MSVIRNNYRPDIDGLRAIAVVSVVFYHVDLGALNGGFVGVDIFFVISGYLITKIINSEIEQGKFTFLGFYERRVRRIFPALFVVLCAALALGAILLLPHDLVLLANQVWTTLIFGSNIFFWRTSGYFDSSSEISPLLHTWSLAVEEQFYVLYPVFLIALHRYLSNYRRIAIITAALLSFGLCVYLQSLRPTATFYLSPFRAWELLLGALLAMNAGQVALQSAVTRELTAWSGLALLVASIVWTSAGVEFPGWHALFPVLGAAMLIYVGDVGGSKANQLLATKPLVFIGLISYSLYLWHWPLIVYSKYLSYSSGHQLGVFERWLLLIVSFFIAYVSYRWVEQPFRRSKRLGGSVTHAKTVVAWGWSAALFVGVMAWFAQIDDGYTARLPPPLQELNAAISPKIPFQRCDGKVPGRVESQECNMGDTSSSRRVLVWGDSHALAWAPGFDALFRAEAKQGVLAIHSACPPLLDVINPVSFGCDTFNLNVMRWLKNQAVDQIILVASWLSYSVPDGQYSIQDVNGRRGNQSVFSPAMQKTITALMDMNIQVTIIAPTPGAPDDVVRKVLLARLHGTAEPEGRPCQAYRKNVEHFWKAINNVPKRGGLEVIDPSVLFYKAGECRYKDDDGNLLYRDGGHLSEVGAIFVTKSLEQEIMGRGVSSVMDMK
jgi:peptidoglycan/LPS O-acetylase OafA/YrhL